MFWLREKVAIVKLLCLVGPSTTLKMMKDTQELRKQGMKIRLIDAYAKKAKEE